MGLLVVTISLAVGHAANTAADEVTHREAVAEAYRLIVEYSDLPPERFAITVPAASFQELTPQSLVLYDALDFIDLPQQMAISFVVDHIGGQLRLRPRWNGGEIEEPLPTPDYGPLATMSVADAIAQEADGDDSWDDLTAVTRYQVTVMLDTREGDRRGGGEIHTFTYDAAAFWFTNDRGEEWMRIVDWTIPTVDSMLVYVARAQAAQAPGLGSTTGAGTSGGQTCVETTDSEPLPPFEAIDREDHFPEGWYTSPGPGPPIPFYLPDSSHGGGVTFERNCTCSQNCQSRCQIDRIGEWCGEVPGNYPFFHLFWPFHKATFQGLDDGIVDANYPEGAPCGAGLACAVKGCVTPFGCSVEVGVTIGLDPVQVSVTLPLEEDRLWAFEPPPKWPTVCPPCSRYLTVAGDAGGEIPAGGSVVLELNSPGSNVSDQKELTGTGAFLFDDELVEDNSYTVTKVAEACVSCTVSGPVSGVATDHVSGIDVQCTANTQQCEHSVSVSITQAEPAEDIVETELWAGPSPSQLQQLESRSLGPGSHNVTFFQKVPSGYSYRIDARTDNQHETCDSAFGEVDDAPVQESITCECVSGGFYCDRHGNEEPQPEPTDPSGGGNTPMDPGLFGGLLDAWLTELLNWLDAWDPDEIVDYDDCESNCDLPQVPCPPPLEGELCDQCTATCSASTTSGHVIHGPTLTLRAPDTDGSPVPSIDASLPFLASATHSVGVAGYVLLLDGEYLADLEAPGSPNSMTLPTTSIDTSGLAEGEHQLTVAAVGDNPGGMMMTPIVVTFDVDHSGGGGGGGGGGGSDTTPPEVTLVSPLDQSTHAPGLITVTATATDDSGIDRVEFFRNGVLRHTATGTLYEWEWDATENTGWNQLKVKAYDASPNQNPAVSALHYVNIQEAPCGDPTPPTVNLTEPAAGSTHTTGSQIRLSASASDSVGVTKVEFFVDSVKVGTATSSPYWFDWTSSGTGPREITAKAFDACNSTVSAPRTITLVSNPCSNPPPPPTVSLTAPASGSTHTTGLPLTISANASPGTTKVEFWRNTSQFPIGVDTTAPYSVSWTPGGTGSVTLTAKAYDGCSTTTSAGRSITLVSNPCAGDTNGPTVEVTWPPSGSLPASEAWEMRASATDPEGNGVDSVEFFVGGSSAGTDNDGAPWEVDWLPLPEPGAYSVKARAVDGCGNEELSPTVNVTLTTGPNPDPPQDP